MTTDKDTDSTPGYGQPVNNCPKRYTLGSKHYKHEVLPCMIEHPQGNYVMFYEYEKLQKTIELQDAFINKHRADIEALESRMKSLRGWRP